MDRCREFCEDRQLRSDPLRTPKQPLTVAVLVPFTLIAASAAPFRIVRPAIHKTISGTYEIVPDVTRDTAAVEYRAGSLFLGISTVSPFNWSWRTQYVSDGNYSLQATAYDAWGHVLAVNETSVDVRNRDCQVTVNSPDLTQPLRGEVVLSLSGYDPRYYPARWNVFIDGNPASTTWTDNSGRNQITATARIDTTRFTDGKHELHVEIASNYWPLDNRKKISWHGYRLCLHRVIIIANGHTLTGITANYQHVYLRPGQSIQIDCRALFSDHRDGSCRSVSYFSNDPKIAKVDAAGRLTAGMEEGFVQVDLKTEGRTASLYTWVRSNVNIPHFSGSGQMLEAYTPGSSMFVIAPFVLQPSDVQNEAVDHEVRRAAINTLYSGFYSNPRTLTAEYDAWRRNYDAGLGASWSWAARHGYHLYTMGDEIARNIGGEAWWTLNWPFAKYAVQYAMSSLAASGVAIAADIIDEGSMMWGATPTPARKVGEQGMFTKITCQAERCTVTWPNNPVNPKRFYAGTQFALTGSRASQLNTPPGHMFQATNIKPDSFEFTPAGHVNGEFTAANDPDLEFLWWAGSAGGCPTAPCDPPVPNTALSTTARWLRSAPSHVPISWPALGIAPPVVHATWAGRLSQVSDFMSHYWDSFQAGRTYSWSAGIAERVYWMRNAFYARQRYVNLDRPQMMLDSISSVFYRKQAPGQAYYRPPADELLAPGTSGPAAFAGMFTAAVLGNAGVRLYQFEEPRNESSRSKAPIGSELQTGASPFADDKNSNEIWKGMSYAANLLTKRLEPFLLGSALSSPALGENIVTAARKNDRGVLLVAINGNDWERTVALDFTLYRTGNPITRYIAGARGISASLRPDAKRDEVLLGPGEAVVYLFPESRSTQYLTRMHVAAPKLQRGAKTAILYQSYIYPQDVERNLDAVECSSGCDLLIDPSVGDVFYTFLFVDRDGTVLKRGPVGKID